jgi:hypothetical protein
MRTLNLKPALLIAALAAGGLLAACGSSSGDSPFVVPPTGTPAPTMEPTPPPDPQALFDGDAAAFLVFLRDLDTAGDPVAVNDGNVRFNDVADNTLPISVNN